MPYAPLPAIAEDLDALRERLQRERHAGRTRRLAAVKAFAADGRPLQLFFEDEARIGLKLPRYRRPAARGVAPKQPYEPLYKYYWLYGAVEPKSGEAFYLDTSASD